MLAISSAPASNKQPVAVQQPVLSPTTSSFSTSSSIPTTKQEAKPPAHVSSARSSGSSFVDNTIDYCRYKEEVTDAQLKKSQSNSGRVQRLGSSTTVEPTVAAAAIPGQTGADSPLVVEVISSGLRSVGSQR
ncbi:hypothetical protein BGX34_008476, partial [Mortierella sp. NVP85]